MPDLRIIYMSQATCQFSPEALTELSKESNRKNAHVQVTGVLVKMGNCFVQVLEGRDAVVMRLFEKIQIDPRHRRVRLIYKEDCDTRAFAQWSMGCVNLDVKYEFDLPSYLELRKKVHSINRSSQNARDAVVAILKVLPVYLIERECSDPHNRREAA